MQKQKNIIGRAIGGVSITASVLLLLIGFTQYNQLFSSTKYDLIKSAKYAQTAINSAMHKQPNQKQEKFDLDSDGEIIITNETPDGKLTRHYRAIQDEKLTNNYDDFPELYLEIIKGNKKEWAKQDIYKIDRKKGLVYFLLKMEKNHQTLFTNLYTGNYKIKLIK